jgi:hypothetical protein
VLGPGRPQLLAHAGAPILLGARVALAKARVTRIGLDLPTRLRVHQPQDADVGQPELARVADLDAE